MVSDQPGILARSIRRFCKDTDLGRSLVYQEIKTGKLRSIKVGRRRLILDEDGRALVELVPASAEKINGLEQVNSCAGQPRRPR